MSTTETDIRFAEEFLADLAEKLEKFVEQEVPHAEAALRRLEEGTFGVCLECEGPIDVERLRALPFVEYCVDCAKRVPLEEPNNDLPPAAPNALPRADCPACGRSTPLRVGGELREHTTIEGGPTKCIASGLTVEAYEKNAGEEDTTGFIDTPVLPGGNSAGARSVSVDLVHPSPENVRDGEIEVDDELKELAESIRSLNLLQRIVVAPDGPDTFEIVAGHRRFAAITKILGWTEVDVDVRELTQQERTEARLIENLQRKDIRPVEEARAIKRLVEEFMVPQRNLATRIGRSQATISKRLSLLELPNKAIELVDSGGITLEEAQHLLKLKAHPELQEKALSGFDPANRWDPIEARVDRIAKDLARKEKVTKRRAQLKEAKVKILTPAKYYDIDHNSRAELGKKPGQLNIAAKLHQGEPCHAAVFDEHSGSVEYVCTDRKRHNARKGVSEIKGSVVPHPKSQQSLLEQENAPLRKALTAEADRRGEFLKDLTGKGLPVDEVLELLVLPLTIESRFRSGIRVQAYDVVEILELQGATRKKADTDESIIRDYAESDPANQLKVLLCVALNAIEEALNPGNWGEVELWGPGLIPYFALLVKHGYAMSDLEAEQLLEERPAKETEGAA